MKTLFTSVSLIAALWTINASAFNLFGADYPEKPQLVRLTIVNPVTIPGMGNDIHVGMIELQGQNGVACALYNYDINDKVLYYGFTAVLKAAYWGSEASWSQNGSNNGVSISCYGGETGSVLRGDQQLDPKALDVINRDMSGQLTLIQVK